MKCPKLCLFVFFFLIFNFYFYFQVFGTQGKQSGRLQFAKQLSRHTLNYNMFVLVTLPTYLSHIPTYINVLIT